MRNILITGGAGFVGRHFTKYFLEKGDKVVVVDCIAPLTGGIDPKNNWPIIDPRDYKNFVFIKNDCRNFFKDNKNEYFDYVLHLAAMVGGRLMIENNPINVADDLSIDAEYWQWAKIAKPKKTLCFSSSAAYPIKYQKENSYKLLKENMISFDQDIGIPDMSYGWAKLTCEYLALLAFEKHGIASVCYRPFSGYGEDQDDSYPFPTICKKVLNEKDASNLKVWGSGKQMRDFIHIDDCVRGVITTMDQISNGTAINLSTGIYTSFIEFAKLAANTIGYNPIISGTSDMPSGVFARAGDTAIQSKLGFTCNISFKSGIERALKYYSKII